MTRSQARSRLESLGKALREYRDRVPREAERFHQALDDLEDRVAARLGRWTPWIADRELQSLERSVERLDEVADALTALLRHRRPNLESRVAELAARSRELQTADSELAAWLDQRCRSWLAEARRLGALVQRANELRRSETLADALERKLERHQLGLDLLMESRQLLASLGSNLDTATLEGELPKLQRRLLQDGPTPAWRQRLADLLGPLRELEPPPPKVEPQEIEKLCLEVREWAGLLGSHRRRADELWRRLPGLRGPQLDELYREIRKLDDELRRRAEEHRQQRLDALGSQITLLGELHRAEPELSLDRDELRPPLDELHQRPVEGPEEHAIWTGELEIIEVKFQDAIKDYLSEIAGYLERRIRDLDGPLKELRTVPLSSQTAAREVQLRDRLAALRQRTRALQDVITPQTDARREVLEIFDGLHAVEEMAGEIGELQRRADQEVEALVSDQRSLARRFETLRSVGARLGHALPDLGPRIASLIEGLDPHASGPATPDSESSGQGNLEASLANAQAFGEELDDHEQTLSEIGRRRLVADRELEARAARALQRAGSDPEADLAMAGSPNGDETLAEIARALDHSDDLRQQLEIRLEQALGELDGRARNAAQALEALDDDALRPETRRQVDRLLRDLRRSDAGDDPISRLEARLDVQSRADELLAQLQRQQRQALAFRDQLLERLAALQAADLRDGCPTLADRIEDLLRGIPEPPQDWDAVERQLELASDLLGRLERHAHRLAVAELEEMLSALRRASSRVADPETEALLDEAAARLDRFPDVGLRRRIRQRFRELPQNLIA